MHSYVHVREQFNSLSPGLKTTLGAQKLFRELKFDLRENCLQMGLIW
jgi:hypothetical protein